MNHKVIVGIILSFFFSFAQASVIDNMLQQYTAEGGKNFSAARGEQMWKTDYPDRDKPGAVRNCSTCHGDDLKIPGKHAKTGKTIDPFSVKVNSERFTDPKFIEKWFKRNCKWVLNRVCTSQEKGDFLMYLRNQ